MVQNTILQVSVCKTFESNKAVKSSFAMVDRFVEATQVLFVAQILLMSSLKGQLDRSEIDVPFSPYTKSPRSLDSIYEGFH